MMLKLTHDRLPTVNPALRAYAAEYAQIYAEFVELVKGVGLDFDPVDHSAAIATQRQRLRDKGALFRNNDHSIHVGRISPSCVACRKGTGSATFYVSLRCHRNCFYCFNPNQEAYDLHREQRLPVTAQIRELSASGLQVEHLALTGGEPLLYPNEAVEFFRTARKLFPQVHTRLYTSGDQIDREILTALREADLQEIRFSVRAHDGEKGRRYTYDRIALAREYIPAVMVETPVLPGTQDIMREMLLEMDRLQIFGVNLLELCFPFHNAEAFRERGFQVRMNPYETLYDYWYAGGLPISRSEPACLDLLEYALDAGLTIGVHYCSLENKHTGQIYQQNWGQAAPETLHFSERDFFLKSAKVFGREASLVQKRFHRAGVRHYHLNREHDYIEFSPVLIQHLKDLFIEIGICSHVVEERAEGTVLREVKIELTTPNSFDPHADL